MSVEQRWKPSEDVKATFEAIRDSFCLMIMKRKATSTKRSTQNTSVCVRGSGAFMWIGRSAKTIKCKLPALYLMHAFACVNNECISKRLVGRANPCTIRRPSGTDWLCTTTLFSFFSTVRRSVEMDWLVSTPKTTRL